MGDLVTYIALGGGLGLGASLQPGPFQAFLVSRAVSGGWRGALPVTLAPLLSDGPVAVLAVLVLGQIPALAQHGLRASGGALLLLLAVKAFRRARGPVAAAETGSGTPRTIVEAALVNLLNPNPYIAWALVMGPAVVVAWRGHPAFAAAFVGAFYTAMIASNAGIVLLAGSARLLDARHQRRLVVASALLLGAIGAILLALGVHGLWRMR